MAAMPPLSSAAADTPKGGRRSGGRSARATENSIETGTRGPTTRGESPRVRVRLYTEAEAGSEPRNKRKPGGAAVPRAGPARA
eukprot:scaffold2247_cov112-Isochrysis_galbana.AAC.2